MSKEIEKFFPYKDFEKFEIILNRIYKEEYVKDLEKENEQLVLYKSVIDDIKHILNNQMDYREFVDIVNAIEEILEKVNK